MVKLTRIYTRTGDDGSTRLGDMSKTRKTDARVAAYGDVNEANAHIGTALAFGGLADDVQDVLVRVQNDMFDVGADLAAPVVPEPKYPPLRVTQPYVDRLEAWCDTYNQQLEQLRSFILPGGSPGAALLHVACTAARRAERSGWQAEEEYGDGVNVLAIKYLNRLSDLLFILARHANLGRGGDVLWRPGGEHQSQD